ncbi:MAG: hypothetical protein AAGA83_26080 [Cyanobacteria bacterium P01_F01_bin.116]
MVGLICLTGSNEVTSSIGYLAPEYLQGSVTNHFPGDAYSLGRTIWAAAIGERPTPGANLVFPEHNLMKRRGPEWRSVVRLIQLLTCDTPLQRLVVLHGHNNFCSDELNRD